MAILRHHQAGAYNNQWYFGGVLTACVTQNGGWNTVWCCVSDMDVM